MTVRILQPRRNKEHLLSIWSVFCASFLVRGAQNARWEAIVGRQVVKDEGLKTLGYIEPLTDGRLKGVDAQQNTVGYYDPDRDATFDHNMEPVGPGDRLSDLIFDARRA